MRVRYAVARKKAIELLDLNGVEFAPVPVERIATSANAVIRYEPLKGELSGMVHRGGDGHAIIGVNSLHPSRRNRFTIAHEIGHLVLHDDELHVDDPLPIGYRNRKSGMAIDPKEIEANQFAAELLMPERLLRSDLAKKGRNAPLTDSEIEELADRYEVSVQAMTIRLSTLGIVPS
jgi:Zn-dependent peptidase ImmA (M78 family)